MFVLVRTDLSPPQQAVQSAHAVLEGARKGLYGSDGDHPHLVLLGVPSKDKLLDAAERIRCSGVSYAVFVEPDLGHEVTAVATGPVGPEHRRFLSKYPLLTLEN